MTTKTYLPTTAQIDAALEESRVGVVKNLTKTALQSYLCDNHPGWKFLTYYHGDTLYVMATPDGCSRVAMLLGLLQNLDVVTNQENYRIPSDRIEVLERGAGWVRMSGTKYSTTSLLEVRYEFFADCGEFGLVAFQVDACGTGLRATIESQYDTLHRRRWTRITWLNTINNHKRAYAFATMSMHSTCILFSDLLDYLAKY